jgi:DNA-binding CsgD family transcriptional regulator
VGDTIVGRTAELETVDRFLSGIPMGTSALVLEGEAGIGKTRLWREGVERAQARGVCVLRSRPGGAEVRLSFSGLGDLLGGSAEAILSQLPHPQRRALAGALLLDELTAALDERAVGAAVVGALRMLAGDAPVVVAVDDLQWLDPPSLRALEYAFRRLEAERVGLLATVRTAAGEPGLDELRRALGDERLLRRRLGSLSVAAVYELVRLRLGTRLSRPALLRLHEVSGGRPFFALELARALAEEGVEPSAEDALPVPRELDALLRARLDRLSPGASSALLLAAALSRPRLSVLEAASDDAADEVAGLREATAAGVVEVEGDRVRFTHPLLASTRYSQASPRERRDVHRRLAQVMPDLEERARHLALSAQGPDERIAQELESAAGRAERRGALIAAARLSEQSIALTSPDAAAALQRRRLAAARLAFSSGATARAEAILDQALGAATPGAERARVLQLRGDIRFETEDTRVALELFRAAADEAGDDLELRLSLGIRLAAAASFWGGGFEVAHAYARDAVMLAEKLGDSWLLAEALCELAHKEFMLGRAIPHELMARAERLEGLAGRRRLWGPSAEYARILCFTGDVAAARERFEPLCEHGRATGDVGVASVLLGLAMVERDAGDLDRALALVKEAHDFAEQSGQDVVDAGAVFALADLEALRGDVEGGRQRALEALEMTERTGRLSGGPRGVLGAMELSVEHYGQAYAYLKPAIDRYQSRGAQMPMSQVGDAVEALAGLSRLDEAERLLDPFEERARALDVRWAIAAAARARGLIEANRDLVAAEAALTRAVAVGEGLPMRLELGRSLLALGTVQRRLRRKAAARTTLDQARELFEGIGAQVWAKRVQAELGRIGGRAALRDGLSETEAQIAALVRDGRTNREIAAALHVSPHTVEWNLSRMYRKLGIRSRTELAARR